MIPMEHPFSRGSSAGLSAADLADPGGLWDAGADDATGRSKGVLIGPDSQQILWDSND